MIILLPFNIRDRALEDNFDLLRSRAMASGVPSTIGAAINGTQAVRVPSSLLLLRYLKSSTGRESGGRIHRSTLPLELIQRVDARYMNSRRRAELPVRLKLPT